MASINYPILTNNLRIDVGVSWLSKDVEDDFFADVLGFQDLFSDPTPYIEARRHRLLQVDALPHIHEHVPKKNRMLRDAIWLHPVHRVLFLSVLRHLIARLDTSFSRSVYSYRIDAPDEPDRYPFSRRLDRWKSFENDFRAAAIDEKSNAVLITDVASFYDQINVTRLCMRIRSILGSNLNAVDEAVVDLLEVLLHTWYSGAYGLPQNTDPSSMLCNAYLHHVDGVMARDFRYFRWMDDIRVVTDSEDDAIRALHSLQDALANDGLYLAADKTEIICRGTAEYDRLLDVEDDVIISSAEDTLNTAHCPTISEIIDTLFERLDFHAGDQGDDRKFRAYANRLMWAADYPELADQILPRLKDFVIPRLRSHPDRSDYWVKFLASMLDEDVETALIDLLITRMSLFAWQRFQLWRLAASFPSPIAAELIDAAVAAAVDEDSELVAAQAIVVAGKHGDNHAREELFKRHFTPQRTYPVQRAALIAIQELPADLRDSLFRRALRSNSDHQELVNYLQNLDEPSYGEIRRSPRVCRDEPKAIETELLRGIGLVKGEKVTFRLTFSDLDY